MCEGSCPRHGPSFTDEGTSRPSWQLAALVDLPDAGGRAISEVIVDDRVLTDAERQQVEQYLKATWGIP